MERNLRVWDDDSREASSKVDDGGGDGDHVTDGFTSGGGAGSEALRNCDGRGEANTSSRVFWITTYYRSRT